MARSVLTDPLMTHNFAVMDVPTNSAFPFAFSIKMALSAIMSGTFVGFSQVTIPEVTIETRDVKEGCWPFVHKVLTGFVTTSEATFTWGVLPVNYDMTLWVKQAIWGRGAPRRDIIVLHTRQDKRIPQRMILLQGCIPTGWKPASDFDANSGDVSLEELTLDVHEVSVIPTPVPVGRPNSSSAPRPTV